MTHAKWLESAIRCSENAREKVEAIHQKMRLVNEKFQPDPCPICQKPLDRHGKCPEHGCMDGRC